MKIKSLFLASTFLLLSIKLSAQNSSLMINTFSAEFNLIKENDEGVSIVSRIGAQYRRNLGTRSSVGIGFDYHYTADPLKMALIMKNSEYLRVDYIGGYNFNLKSRYYLSTPSNTESLNGIFIGTGVDFTWFKVDCYYSSSNYVTGENSDYLYQKYLRPNVSIGGTWGEVFYFETLFQVYYNMQLNSPFNEKFNTNLINQSLINPINYYLGFGFGVNF